MSEFKEALRKCTQEDLKKLRELLSLKEKEEWMLDPFISDEGIINLIKIFE